METDRLIQLLTDYLDGNLSMEEKISVEEELASNPSARKMLKQLQEVFSTIAKSPVLEPNPEIKQKFDAMLKAEIAKKEKAKTVFFQSVYFKVAATVLMLIIAGGVGFYIGGQRSGNTITENKKTDQTVLLAKLKNQYAVSERLIGINEVVQSSPDDRLVTVLITLMNEDSNTNVRLAAVNALVRFYDEPLVREALIDALSTQTDPLVQLELIQILVYKKEQEAVTPLENIIKDDQTLQAVKDEAYAGLFSLS
jgi:flagellar basal body-associated protein FliL